MGYCQARSTQDYQILASIASAMFGSKKKEPPKSFSEAKNQFEALFGK